ncbi:UNVERIFIED_CONTAM: hypothetical protein Scaly_2811900 [Sesamum calycinum]|uniref:Uncharacterized protein n=1 Tax=Sesamum calycinum TaxID=2727403 RepID=A0AAW2IV40_9LAMI
MKELVIPMDDLSNSLLMIQNFNQGGQTVTSVIRIEVLMDDMASTALFHIIDAKISYYMLLGRSWLHENFVVSSTWHQKDLDSRSNFLLPGRSNRDARVIPTLSNRTLFLVWILFQWELDESIHLHVLQCFKYYHNGTMKNVLGDSKLLTEAELHFADAKYYIEDAKNGKDVLLSGQPKSYGD